MFKPYISITWLGLKFSLYFIIPLTALGYGIEMLFDIIEGNAIDAYFTLTFFKYFIFHELMFILYASVGLLSFIGAYVYVIKIKPRLKPTPHITEKSELNKK